MVVKFVNRSLVVTFVVLVALAGSPRAGAWAWPVDGPVLRPFVGEGDPYAGGQHRGIDIGAPTAGDVRSPASGVVAFAGRLPREGLCLTIRTPDGYSVTLVHLGSIGVSVGTAVEEGEVVGTVGPSGEPEGPEPYLHLGIRLTADPHGYLDPLSLLPPRRFDEPPPPSQSQQQEPPATTSAAPSARVSPGRSTVTPKPAQPARPRRVTRAPRTSRAPVRSRAPAPVPRPRAPRSRSGTSRPAPARVSTQPPRVPAPPVTRRTSSASSVPVPARPTRASTRSVPRSGFATPLPEPKRAARRKQLPLVLMGLVGLALLAAGGVLRGRAPDAVPAPSVRRPLRKMSFTEPGPEERLPEPQSTANSHRRRLAVRQRPEASRPCRGVRRAVGHRGAVSPASRRPGAHGQRQRRARDAGDGRRRPRRAVAA